MALKCGNGKKKKKKNFTITVISSLLCNTLLFFNDPEVDRLRKNVRNRHCCCKTSGSEFRLHSGYFRYYFQSIWGMRNGVRMNPKVKRGEARNHHPGSKGDVELPKRWSFEKDRKWAWLRVVPGRAGRVRLKWTWRRQEWTTDGWRTSSKVESKFQAIHSFEEFRSNYL